jgi:hypothetical protein
VVVKQRKCILQSLIFQRRMLSAHAGDLRVTGPIQGLERELNRAPATVFPANSSIPWAHAHAPPEEAVT